MTDRLGMIVRADDGGLGSCTLEAWRHLRPDRTLIVLTDHTTRGRADVLRYMGGRGEVRSCRRMPDRHDIEWLLHGIDVLYSMESNYSAYLPGRAAGLGVRTVLHAMTEMHDPRLDVADVVLATTEGHGIEGATVLPVPVATDRFIRREITECRTFYHVASEAMCDRNGTELVLAACEMMTAPARLLIRGPYEPRAEQRGPVTVEWLGHHHGPYWEAWPADVDALVLPRRYAFLNLPAQEAAAQGLPIVDLDRAPQNGWLPAEAVVPCEVSQRQVRMRGGRFDVYGCASALLAAKLDSLVSDPALVARLSAASRAWAESISWDRLLPEYEVRLRS